MEEAMEDQRLKFVASVEIGQQENQWLQIALEEAKVREERLAETLQRLNIDYKMT